MITVGDAVGHGEAVDLPDGLQGQVLAVGPATKAAASTEEWRALVQFAVDSAGPFAHDLFVLTLAGWLSAKLAMRGSDKAKTDKGAVRVFIGHTEVDPSDQAAIERAIAGQLDAGTPMTLPPQLVPTYDGPAGLTDEQWVKTQLELRARYHERVAQLLRDEERPAGKRHRKRKK